MSVPHSSVAREPAAAKPRASAPCSMPKRSRRRRLRYRLATHIGSSGASAAAPSRSVFRRRRVDAHRRPGSPSRDERNIAAPLRRGVVGAAPAPRLDPVQKERKRRSCGAVYALAAQRYRTPMRLLDAPASVLRMRKISPACLRRRFHDCVVRVAGTRGNASSALFRARRRAAHRSSRDVRRHESPYVRVIVRMHARASRSRRPWAPSRRPPQRRRPTRITVKKVSFYQHAIACVYISNVATIF